MEEFNIEERTTNANAIRLEARIYLVTGKLEALLAQKVNALKDQDPSMSILDAIEILLDYVEREFDEIFKKRALK